MFSENTSFTAMLAGCKLLSPSSGKLLIRVSPDAKLIDVDNMMSITKRLTMAPILFIT
jgi:hypothetical protein